MNDAKLEREREFHNRRFDGEDNGRDKKVAKFYSICSSFGYYRNLLGRQVDGIRVLEYGCGAGSMAFWLAKQGAHVTGIDISDVAIEKAREQAEREGLDGIDFRVMNAEQLDFEADSFDLICGCAILHHLALDKTYAELGRVLDPGGRAVFLEPLGHNPAINLYRRLTPSIRTVDEHPLVSKEVDAARDSFDGIELRFFALMSLLAVPFRSFPFFNSMRRACDAVDQALFRAVPVSRWYAWEIVLEFSRPRKP